MKFRLGLAVALATLPAAAHAQTVPDGYHLVWSDEFSKGGAPDPAKWGYQTQRNRDGWWNKELEYYSAHRLENARVAHGDLIIEARHESLTGQRDYGGQKYSSARLTTNGKASWTYGFFDVRAKLPCGVGQWPAIWLIGGWHWPQQGEIDIMEEVGFEPTTVYGTLHSTHTVEDEVHQGGHTEVADLCRAFHDYQAEWTADHITFLVDNKPYYRLDKPAGADARTWPFDQPEYMILNVAVGGTWGGRQGVDDTAFPAQMQIDYVRVYQK
ncbi:glycoside hydrolase family 16 protein [Asticcacaulis sp. EMRT-3]|uniref:glycoside hydrolase family 16 protein n=1 Tax=Asticcacaulis sp. EMRT-3 TaxID=3040349 RepID=UPI0024AF9C42|nr:glycoside hydrolase family 16 protein [Asticcacaulis sp. EMRT-3]MDI7774318.1 glycoside hydrolase family 16 protein [Asticcacaulis sp. EMRT-3]